MDESRSSVVFTIDELWLLQSVVRHEVAQMEGWTFPPASLDLNDRVAEAVLFCSELGIDECALQLSRADCLAIDACVPQSAKSPAGIAIGKSALLKSYRARKELRGEVAAAVEEPPALSTHEIREQLRGWEGR